MAEEASKIIGIKPPERPHDLKYKYPFNVIYQQKFSESLGQTEAQFFSEKVSDDLNVDIMQKDIVLKQKKELIEMSGKVKGKISPSESTIKNV